MFSIKYHLSRISWRLVGSTRSLWGSGRRGREKASLPERPLSYSLRLKWMPKPCIRYLLINLIRSISVERFCFPISVIFLYSAMLFSRRQIQKL